MYGKGFLDSEMSCRVNDDDNIYISSGLHNYSEKSAKFTGACTRTHKHTHAHTQTHTHTRTHTYTHTYTHIHTYTHTYTQPRMKNC